MDVESATLATGREPEAMRETTPRWPTKKVGRRHQHIPPATQTRPVSNIHINRQRTTQRPHLGPIGSGRSQLVDPREPVHQRRVTTIRRHPQPGLPPPPLLPSMHNFLRICLADPVHACKFHALQEAMASPTRSHQARTPVRSGGSFVRSFDLYQGGF